MFNAIPGICIHTSIFCFVLTISTSTCPNYAQHDFNLVTPSNFYFLFFNHSFHTCTFHCFPNVSLTNQETKSEEESIFVIDFVPKGRREKEKRERE